MPARSTLLAALLAAALAPLAGCVSTENRPAAPTHPLYQQGEQRLLQGDRDGALASFRACRQGFTSGGDGYASDCFYWEGTILLEKGDAAGAARAFEGCLRRPRTRFLEAQAAIGLGDCYFVQDRFDDAIAAYQRALDTHAQDARNDYCYFRLAAARQRHGEWSRGRTCYELIMRDFPRSIFALRARERLSYPDQSFHLQVATFQDEENANTFVGFVQSKGVAAKVVHPVAAADAPYLVWVGTYTRYEDARGAVGEVQQICGKDVTLVP